MYHIGFRFTLASSGSANVNLSTFQMLGSQEGNLPMNNWYNMVLILVVVDEVGQDRREYMIWRYMNEDMSIRPYLRWPTAIIFCHVHADTTGLYMVFKRLQYIYRYMIATTL